MSIKHTARKLGKIAVSFSVAGTLLATSCGTDELRALAAGIQAATNQLDDDNDITFVEFLLSELDD